MGYTPLSPGMRFQPDTLELEDLGTFSGEGHVACMPGQILDGEAPC